MDAMIANEREEMRLREEQRRGREDHIIASCKELLLVDDAVGIPANDMHAY